MNTLSLTVRYRPLRMGWCVQSGDFAALRNAIELNTVFWGGWYNPIIPADKTELADQLIKLFRVDVLWPLSNTPQVTACIQRHPHLINPFHHEQLFVEWRSGRRSPLLVDIYHPIVKLRDDLSHVRDPKLSTHVLTWDDTDPLSNVMAMMYGVVPTPDTTNPDYIGLIKNVLAPSEHTLAADAEIPAFILHQWPISAFSHAFLERHYVVRHSNDEPGFYMGDAADFVDLISFWNLRATDISLMFYDPNHAQRFTQLRSSWKDALEAFPSSKRRRETTISLWSRTDTMNQDVSEFGSNVRRYPVDPLAWNIKAPYMYFSQGAALASVSEADGRAPRIAFPLPKKPLQEDDRLFDQHLVASIDPGIGLFGNEQYTIELPFLPKLNEYYGRHVWFKYDEARAEPDSLGIICGANKHDLSINALPVITLATEIFKLAGISATVSKPGLIASRLIEQMGGLQGCRAFKIPGVRKLLERYGPDQHFTWSGATLMIRDVDPTTNIPSLEAHNHLFIEARSFDSTLTAESVFKYLLGKEVFRPGLALDCPSCRLSFWLPLDQVRTQSRCEYCGHSFNVTPFLKDRGDWAFRRSGLFGASKNLEGAVPVALTLQQLNTTLHHEFIYTPAMNLSFNDQRRLPCETDYIVLHRNPRGKIDICLGEAKSRKEITDGDVANLGAVADAFPRENFNPYVAFSKLIPFSTAEIERIRHLNDSGLRPIMLTPRELEPYFVYERTAKEFAINESAVSLADMARVTAQVYFA